MVSTFNNTYLIKYKHQFQVYKIHNSIISISELVLQRMSIHLSILLTTYNYVKVVRTPIGINFSNIIK